MSIRNTGNARLRTSSLWADRQIQPEVDGECWTNPEHIVQWNHASDNWHCPAAENDLRPGGRFSYAMTSRNEPMRFHFEGVYREIDFGKSIAYTTADGREVTIGYYPADTETRVVETFGAESTHSPELQRDGWQAILNNFKRYTIRLASQA